MIGGAIVVAAGVYLLFQGVQYSSSALVDYTQIEAVSIGAVGVLGGLYVRWVLGPLRNKRNLTGSESLVGELGVAVSPLTPTGEVRVKGIIWRAKSVAGHIGKGDPVKVKEVEGLTLVVEGAEQAKA
jgi:membrane-bound serine protease (ClpP class)